MFKKIFGHRSMLAHPTRVASYQQAIRNVVKAGDVVADIGTGSGILAFLAVRAGAKKVYAIEEKDIIKEAEELAKINGMADRIAFIRERSDRVELPERADVVVSELIGNFGIDENVVGFITDARARFLKPGGKLVPEWLALYLVPVESEAVWQDYVGIWNNDYYGLDFSPVRTFAVSQRHLVDCSGRAEPLSRPGRVLHIDFYEIEHVPTVFQGDFVVRKNGTFHGLVGFIKKGASRDKAADASAGELPDGIPPTSYFHNFFPLEAAVPVENGDTVRCRITAMPHLPANTMFWKWETAVDRNRRTIAAFTQSDLLADISGEELATGKTDFRPVLSKKGEMNRRILALCNGKTSVKEIAETVWSEFPDQYSSFNDALRSVAGIVQLAAKIP